jgi:hypothetical protein
VLVLFGVAPGIAINPVDTATGPLLERVRPIEATQLEGPDLILR